MGVASQLSGSVNVGVSVITVIFILGLILFNFSARLGEERIELGVAGDI